MRCTCTIPDPVLLKNSTDGSWHCRRCGVTTWNDLKSNIEHKMNFSPEYAKLQHDFHLARPDYGISGHKYAANIQHLSEKMQTRDILDYGCGKATLQKSLPFPIQNYDPFMEEYSIRPHPAEIVVCTDVMEHIELLCLNDVLQDIYSLTKRLVFFQIATRPAAKFLPDGRNAHLIQEPVNWWLTQLMHYFDVRHLDDMGGGFILIATPVELDIEMVEQPGNNPDILGADNPHYKG